MRRFNKRKVKKIIKPIKCSCCGKYFYKDKSKFCSTECSKKYQSYREKTVKALYKQLAVYISRMKINNQEFKEFKGEYSIKELQDLKGKKVSLQELEDMLKNERIKLNLRKCTRETKTINN